MEPERGYAGDAHHEPRLRSLEETVRQISDSLERSKIAEYVDLLNHPWRLIYLNLIGGLSRGVGLAIGFTVLSALLIYVLTRSFILNLPLVGNFLGELVWIIQEYLRAKP
ncbi:MAG TPA: hypothetical protein GX529_08405 [Firmicutes bacterium]|nr:hypothetical protein [Candidatus Fermentithermobacillaceae bacterium]